MTKIHFRNKFHKYCKIVRALVARAILVTHGAVAVELTARQSPYFYSLMAALGVLFAIETFFIIYFRSGCEWKRFCTCFLCYLLTIIPCLWIQRLGITIPGSQVNQTDTLSTTTLSTQHVPQLIQLLDFPTGNGTHKNNTLINTVLSAVDPPSFIEQSMMFVIIIVRWLLPRGLIDRKSLSQLLIMYCAIGADILDFSEIFDKIPPEVDTEYRYIVLAVWSWSLLQFTLVITTAFSAIADRQQVRQSVAHLDIEVRTSVEDNENKSELMSLVMVFLMQDGPFLVTRCYTIFIIGVQDYLIIFFALKNFMTIVLGLFRMLVLCGFIAHTGDDLLMMEEAVTRPGESVAMRNMKSAKGVSKSKNKSGKSDRKR